VDTDYSEAIKWYRLAADQGYPEAENNLGALYEAGLGAAQDEVIAVKWFRLAAVHENVKAQTNLGIMYANGKGVPQDFTEARNWFQRAADRGEPKALSNLGAPYATGRGVPQNLEEAAKWYDLASRHGDPGAGSTLERIRLFQAQERRLQEERTARTQIPSAPQQRFVRIEPTMFRLSTPMIERRTVKIGTPSVGFRGMAAHFGRR
jgi:TPR repeat protein